MSSFISTQGGYYEGDRIHPLDLAVPQRPGPYFVWDSESKVWMPGAPPPNNSSVTLSERQRRSVREELDARIDDEPMSDGLRSLLRSLVLLTDKET